MPTDYVTESLGARWFAEKSTIEADGVGGGQWLAMMVTDATKTPGAMARATKSSEAGAGAAGVVPEPEA